MITINRGEDMNGGEKIEILNFHKILYAHTHTAENYSYTLDSTTIGQAENGTVCGGIVEVGFVENIPLVFRSADGAEYTAGEGEVFVIPPMKRLEVRQRGMVRMPKRTLAKRHQNRTNNL